MGFIGGFLVTILIGIFGVLVWIALALIVLAILFIFIPCLIIAIINLVKGAKNKWPKRNVIPLVITGPISILFLLAITIFLIAALVVYITNPSFASSSSSSAQIVSTINLLLMQ